MMLTKADFSKKQIVVIFSNDGEKMSLSNSNLIVKNIDGKVKFQCTCYRLFVVFIIGHCSITTPLLQAAQKFGFFFALMTPSFRLYSVIGAGKYGNTLLHRKQYQFNEIYIASHIIRNKIDNQIKELQMLRKKSIQLKEDIDRLVLYKNSTNSVESINELMAYEGLVSKIYFKHMFSVYGWKGRQPRVKRDYINSALDIGYSILFSFLDAILSCFGFDTFCGVMHKEFYMRKSLVCDLMEPFRCIIDHEVKRGIGLKQIKEDDYIVVNHQYKLKWEESPRYARLFLLPIIEYKDEIFSYVRVYYLAFMKELSESDYPVFTKGDVK